MAKGRKNGLYRGISDELSALMRTGWADTEQHDLRPNEQAAHAARRRAALSALFPGERLVVPSGGLKTRSNDTHYPFRPYSGYVHLTGDQTRDGALVLEPRAEGGHDAHCYQLPRDSRDSDEFWTGMTAELWMGRRRSLAESEQVLGLPCRDIRTISGDLAHSGVPTRVVRGHAPAIEASLVTDEERDAELEEALSGLRLVKDAWEIGELRRAVDSTVRGFTDVVRELSQAVATSERWIEGTFFRRARVEGNDVGYGSICAAGEHATIMHWVENDGPVRPGELLLLDAGVETRTLYTADVTRTLPISGTFSPIQREVYDAVFEAQEAGMAAVKPGALYRDFHDAAQWSLTERLVAWGFIEGPVERAFDLGLQRRFTMAGTGHMLGLDVHDCARARNEDYVGGVLEPGMVLTVEPGLYFQPDDLTVPEEWRGIGVRIEDDLLVTADGHENLSGALPRSADEVEAWMREFAG
ncbi:MULTISPECIES: aminopeptidase P family protein [unclassified Streptomyces]|uniref:aminopeptidase P family protein n=1 Tax=unclassified Streptomyces TaxID=2593676 RepID=UPI002253CD83|nr:MULTISPECIES: aminopeptidase P family protein [unclassified Streptomyces]MCX4987356.1 aminopeptidase P family protein [Streptomyces sp. NBC_00568]MCX5007511.1 aminopeptidase P family protein [Streptomyces sp. NBC_00638]